MDEYYESDSDYEIQDVRDDFEYIWGKNIVQVDYIHQTNPDANDYFHEGEATGEYRRKVWVNIQGLTSEHYKRAVMGIISPDANYHAYFKYDEDIKNNDLIKFGTWLFRIQNFNESFYQGQMAFKECDLKRIDKED